MPEGIKKPKKPKAIPVPQLMAGLIEDGYTIRIHHIRFFPWLAKKDPDNEDEAEQYMTRGQYNQALEDKTLALHITNVKDLQKVESDRVYQYGEAVSPLGGWTRVNIEKEGQIMTIGKRNFGRSENFCRRKGVDGAFRMAYNILQITLKEPKEEAQGSSEERLQSVVNLASRAINSLNQ